MHNIKSGGSLDNKKIVPTDLDKSIVSGTVTQVVDLTHGNPSLIGGVITTLSAHTDVKKAIARDNYEIAHAIRNHSSRFVV
jgi:hypothetical protein